jgi:hypothetical protein
MILTTALALNNAAIITAVKNYSAGPKTQKDIKIRSLLIHSF